MLLLCFKVEEVFGGWKKWRRRRERKGKEAQWCQVCVSIDDLPDKLTIVEKNDLPDKLTIVEKKYGTTVPSISSTRYYRSRSCRIV